jgi:transcriptional regulator with XRE-family HTH domain
VVKNYVLTEDVLKAFLGTLGRRIKQLRKEKKLLMRDIMVKTGYYDAQWRKYEAGGNLNIPSLMKVAVALDVTLIELLDGLGHWPRVSVPEIVKHYGIEPAIAVAIDLECEPEQPITSRSRRNAGQANSKRTSSKVTASQEKVAKTTFSASPVERKRKTSK